MIAAPRSRCGSAPATPPTTPPARPPTAPTSCSRKASAKASTGRCWSSRRSRPRARSRRTGRLPGARASGRARSNSSAPRSPPPPASSSVAPAKLNPAGDVATITVYPHSSPQAYATTQLVATPARQRGPAARSAARGHDRLRRRRDRRRRRLRDRRSATSCRCSSASSCCSRALLLMIVFRSLVIPLQAAVMNLLSIGASLGVIVAIFQWGWLGGLFGVQQGPIESFIPVMLFAIVFGLSMDYEVFLISRMHERWTQTARTLARGRRGPRADRARRHRGRGDHGLRVPVVHARRRPRHQGVRPEPRQRRVPRRARRALPAAARGAARSSARAPGGCRRGSTAAAAPEHRGQRCRAARGRARAGDGRRQRRAAPRPGVATEGAEG